MSAIINNIVIGGGTAFILNKAFKSLGKKNYSDLIAFTGICYIGISIAEFTEKVSERLSDKKVVENSSNAIKGVTFVFKTFADIGNVLVMGNPAGNIAASADSVATDVVKGVTDIAPEKLAQRSEEFKEFFIKLFQFLKIK